MGKRLLAGLLVVAMAVIFLCPVSALADNPTVSITVSAQIVAITNSQNTFAVGTVEAGDSVTKWGSSDNYSQIENTGNVAVDIEIQGTDLEGGSYDWTLGTTAGDKVYSLYANSEATPATYDIEVKSSSYNDLTTNLAASDTYDWSMQFTPPTTFDPSDDGSQKSATVTLVASKHV